MFTARTSTMTPSLPLTRTPTPPPWSPAAQVHPHLGADSSDDEERRSLHLREQDAPFVRYRPTSSVDSDLESSGEDSLHDSDDSRATLPSIRLPSYRAVCNICLADFQLQSRSSPSEELRKLPCSHVYHNECVSRAINQSQRTQTLGEFECPTCRRTVPLQSTPAPALPSANTTAPIMRALPSTDSITLPRPRRLHRSTSSPDHRMQVRLPEAPLIPLAYRGDHRCRLRHTLKSMNHGFRQPCFPEDRVPWLHNSSTAAPSRSVAPHATPDTSTRCEICGQTLNISPDDQFQLDADTRLSLVPRRTPCGHIFHAECMDALLPVCECIIPPGGVLCPTCNAPIPLRSRGLYMPENIIDNPFLPLTGGPAGPSAGNVFQQASLPGLLWLAPAADDLHSIDPPSTWYHDLVRDDRLLSRFHRTLHLRKLAGNSRSLRFIFRLQSIFSGTPHFGEYLADLQEDGKIRFESGTIRGPEGLWAHYIRITSVDDSTLGANTTNEAAWGVQWTEHEAKDVAALKLLQQLWDVPQLSDAEDFD